MSKEKKKKCIVILRSRCGPLGLLYFIWHQVQILPLAVSASASALTIPHIRIAFTVIVLCQFLRRPAIKMEKKEGKKSQLLHCGCVFRVSISDKWIVHWNVICYALSVKLFLPNKSNDYGNDGTCLTWTFSKHFNNLCT